MVVLSRITTKTGDGGQTGLGDGSRIAKDSPRIEAIGAVDEANAAIGLARACCQGEDKTLLQLTAVLLQTQNHLFDLGSDLCRPMAAAADQNRFPPERIAWLESKTESFNRDLPPLSSFILPGGNLLAAQLHLARTIVRRAERRVFTLARVESLNPNLAPYLNRLSDFLFVASRLADPQAPLWQPGG
ncbi:MAG: cob(I)yrinic acid a,c-diamide adenosyltransferase [Candidatus Pacebacteria bacterium]|nr:cob(I)yrinic acid a,c-diamide adenosyltransferase [Candidatus Paceibacterota bacterium]